MIDEGKQFKMTIKTKICLWFHEVLGAWSQWFIRNCDTEPFNLEGLLSEEEIEEFGEMFLKNVDGELGLDEET